MTLEKLAGSTRDKITPAINNANIVNITANFLVPGNDISPSSVAQTSPDTC